MEEEQLILGITFKQNCPDVGNTKAVNVLNQLKNHNQYLQF